MHIGNKLRAIAATIGVVVTSMATADPAGAQTTIRTAVVSSGGKLVRGKGAVSARLVPGPAGFYEVKFLISVTQCAFFVTPGNPAIFSDPGPFTAGATLSPFDLKTVVVKTSIPVDIPANTAFSLLVVC